MRIEITSSAAIRHIVGDTMTERGRRYYKDGAVMNVVVQEQGIVKARVKGSFAAYYEVTLRFGDDDEKFQVDCQCTCPVAYDCKHAAAVMFWLMDRPLGDRATSGLSGDPSRRRSLAVSHAQQQGDELAQWLATLDAIDGGQESKPKQKKTSDRPDQQLYFLLGATTKPVSLTMVVSTKPPQVHDPELIDPWDVINTYGQVLDESDNQLLMELNQVNAFNAGDGQERMPLPISHDCGPLLQQILASGRCYLPGEWRHEQLTLAPGRAGTLYWDEQVDTDNESNVANPSLPSRQRLKLQFDGSNESTISLLSCAPPFFLDHKRFNAGPVLTDLLPVHVAQLLNAPGLSIENVMRIRDRLETTTALTKLPAPKTPEERVIDGVKPQPVLTVGLVSALAPCDEHQRPCVHGFHMDEVSLACVEPGFLYDGVFVGAGESQPVRHFDGGALCLVARDIDAEQEALAHLHQFQLQSVKSLPNLHPERVLDDCTLYIANGIITEEQDPYRLIGDEVDYAQFEQAIAPALEEQGWHINFSEKWPFTSAIDIDDWYVNIDSSDTDWFSVGVGLSADGDSYDLAEPLASYIQALDDATIKACEEDSAVIEQLLKQRPLLITLNSGDKTILPYKPLVTLFKALLALFGSNRHDGPQNLPIEAASLLYDAQQSDGRSMIQWRGGERIFELGRRLGDLESGQMPTLPPNFKADLRPYQLTGLAWFQALSTSGFGGVLADDMGLGKTVQTLAFLAAAKVALPHGPPVLIVAPTSVIGNWCREIDRFAPDLRTLVWHGAQRAEQRADLHQADVIVTSFGLARRDHDTLAAIEWRYLIIDEAQNIKNPQSATHRTLSTYKAAQRFALTGTPLENNLDELWSLFHLVVPGLLGKRADFRKRYRVPIERHSDNERQRHLARLIRPFLLRRNKEEVAKDLPEKIIIDETVTLSEQQAALYETIRVSADKRIREALRDKGMASSQITILDALLKMRQVCCDPQLVKLKAAREVTESAKRERCLELVDTLVEEGRRILVFSQFVTMLDILSENLKEQKVEHLMLTGKTRQRDKVIDRFQQGKVPVFLISLKAGGAGLNLTAADTVIIYDPWWNPAAEAQAMDRTHRIGQTRSVFVYRLLADKTLETSIQEMQKRKAALAKSVLDAENAGSLSLQESDIDVLLAPMA